MEKLTNALTESTNSEQPPRKLSTVQEFELRQEEMKVAAKKELREFLLKCCDANGGTGVVAEEAQNKLKMAIENIDPANLL